MRMRVGSFSRRTTLHSRMKILSSSWDSCIISLRRPSCRSDTWRSSFHWPFEALPELPTEWRMQHCCLGQCCAALSVNILIFLVYPSQSSTLARRTMAMEQLRVGTNTCASFLRHLQTYAVSGTFVYIWRMSVHMKGTRNGLYWGLHAMEDPNPATCRLLAKNIWTHKTPAWGKTNSGWYYLPPDYPISFTYSLVFVFQCLIMRSTKPYIIFLLRAPPWDAEFLAQVTQVWTGLLSLEICWCTFIH